jgi:hypothetical protein
LHYVVQKIKAKAELSLDNWSLVVIIC